MPIYLILEGLETYNDLIKIIVLLLCTSIRHDSEILLDYNYMYISHNNLT